MVVNEQQIREADHMDHLLETIYRVVVGTVILLVATGVVILIEQFGTGGL